MVLIDISKIPIHFGIVPTHGYLLLCLHQGHVGAVVVVCVQGRYDFPSHGVKHGECRQGPCNLSVFGHVSKLLGRFLNRTVMDKLDTT